MNIAVELPKVKKDHYDLRVNGVSFGIFERSQLRQLIQEIDNEI